MNGKLVFSRKAAIIEMPEDVRVRVDPPGSDGQSSEIIDDRADGGVTTDANDFSALDNDDRVVEYLASTVQNGRGLQNNGALLARGRGLLKMVRQ